MSDPRPALLARLTAAEAMWTAGASGCTAYHYGRYYESFLAGTQITTVQIADGHASLRREWTNGGQQMPQIQWTEGPNDIGSHPSGTDDPVIGSRPPYPASTVAQLFAECRIILNQSPSQYEFQLSINDMGIPTTCMKRLLNCVDDCHSGIFLAGFSCGSLNPCSGPACVGSGPYDYQCVRSGSCDMTAVCLPLADSVSCGPGTCQGGTCQ